MEAQTTDTERDQILSRADFVDPSWVMPNQAYYISKNGLGSYWPKYIVKATCGGWCPIIIRDSNPFKTLAGAVKFIEKCRNRYIGA
jgi:hypothetical protein